MISALRAGELRCLKYVRRLETPEVSPIMRQHIKPPTVRRCRLTTSADSVSQFGETPYRIPRIGEPYLGLHETGHLDRLGRSVLHLIGLGAELREKGVGLKVLEQGIDTSTAEGRAMFGMLSVLAELQRELIVANTRDGLAAARARGRKGGRPPKLTTEQVEHAQRLYDAGEHTVAQIADLLGVRRTTLYGHLNKAAAKHPTPASPERHAPAAGADELEHSATPRKTPRACPSCGHEPTTRGEAAHQRADLAVTWLHLDPNVPGEVVARNHCRSCQPGEPAVDVACTVCGDGPILAGELAADVGSDGGLPRPVRRWLTDAGWRTNPKLLCPDHA